MMDAERNQIIAGKYGVRESSDGQLLTFLKSLQTKGLKPVSCTLDGNPQAIKAMKIIWPDIVIQRSLVHIQRQGLSWCRRNPKTPAARELRDIFLEITHVRTGEERDEILELIIQWEQRYGQYIKIQPERGRVFSDVKRARSMLMKALPNLFHYLNDPGISFTTNRIESYFSRLKNHYRQHRGLRKKKLDNYFNWYLFYKPK
jgi:transposase-like protein